MLRDCLFRGAYARKLEPATEGDSAYLEDAHT